LRKYIKKTDQINDGFGW